MVTIKKKMIDVADAATSKVKHQLRNLFILLSLVFLSFIIGTRSTRNAARTSTTLEVQTMVKKQNVSSTKNEPVATKSNETVATKSPYFTLWNHTTHSINIPSKPQGMPLTSLEILEQVLIDNDVGNITKTLPRQLFCSKHSEHSSSCC
jgi:hypothetical protein